LVDDNAAALTILRNGSRGKRTEARVLLAPMYGWCTEGFATVDLQEAKVLLEELGG
jgi:predicted ATPase